MAALLQKNKGFRWPQLSLSILLHFGIAAALLWRFHPDPVIERSPVSVELWAGGGTGQGKGASGYLPDASIAKQAEISPNEPPAPKPSPSVTPSPPPSKPSQPTTPIAPTAPTPRPSIKAPSLPHADVKLAETKPTPKPSKPHKPAPPVQKTPASKPEPKKTEEKPTVKTPTPQKGTATGAKPHGSQAARPGAKSGNALDDLLGDLDGPTGSGRDAVSQKGQAAGVRSGSPNGSGVNKEAYIDKVRAKIRPYVMVPPSISGNPEAVVKVILLPSLEVRSVQLIKSSGNPAYDKSIVDAVWQAKTFPHLPQGAAFVDFREYSLRFRPRE